jgi:hypothetical protein
VPRQRYPATRCIALLVAALAAGSMAERGSLIGKRLRICASTAAETWLG